MTPVEWTAVKRHVDALWGKTPKWAGYGRLINQVKDVDYAEAIRVVDRHVGGFIPAPADIIGARQPASVPSKRRPLVFVPVHCDNHSLKAAEGSPRQICMNVGCDYETDKIGDQNNAND